MAKPIPSFVPRDTYFFTVRLQDPKSALLVTHIDTLRQATRLCRKRWPFEIAGAVVLPNVAHMIWVLPAGDTDFAKRWRLIKSGFSRHVPAPDYVAPSSARRGDKGIWQRRFWEHRIDVAQDYDLHMHLIRSAPIHAGLVKGPRDWPYSSFYRADPARTTALAPSSPDQAIAAMTN